VEILGYPLLPIDSQGKYVLEDVGGSSSLLVDTLLRAVRDRHIPARVGSDLELTVPTASFVSAWSQGFFHWVADYLPRVRGLEVYAAETGTYPEILIAENAPSWQRESLRIIGVPDDKIVKWTGDRVRAKRFIVPSLPRHTDSDKPPWGWTQSPQALKWTRNRILSKLGLSQRNENRILITRRGAESRRFYNEDSVIAALEQYGFEPVVLSNLPFREQVRLFAHAEAIVAPHGAGLINTIYGSNLRIMELFGEYVNACYYTLAGGFGHIYRYHLCENTDGDMIVDIELIKRSIQDMLS
jgi:capsular polysaccharide biosynthesis protein